MLVLAIYVSLSDFNFIIYFQSPSSSLIPWPDKRSQGTGLGQYTEETDLERTRTAGNRSRGTFHEDSCPMAIPIFSLKWFEKRHPSSPSVWKMEMPISSATVETP
jgi:hypothetical protein